MFQSPWWLRGSGLVVGMATIACLCGLMPNAPEDGDCAVSWWIFAALASIAPIGIVVVIGTVLAFQERPREFGIGMLTTPAFWGLLLCLGVLVPLHPPNEPARCASVSLSLRSPAGASTGAAGV